MGIPLAGRSSYERERGEKEETSAAAGALSLTLPWSCMLQFMTAFS